MTRAFLLATAITATAAVPSLACQINYPRTIGGAPLAVIATARAGTPCLVPVRTGRGVVRAVLASRPRNGSAAVSANGVTYTPRGGWRGTDRFSFQRVVTENGAVIAREAVNVSVVVR